METRHEIWTLANAVTAVKLPLAAVFPWCTGDARLELGVLFVGGVSDFADGRIARHYGTAGGFGAILDPICDKVFLLMVVGTYVAQQRLPLGSLGIVILRDVYVVLASVALLLSGRWKDYRIEARFPGKTVTFLQFFLFGFMTLGLPTGILLGALLGMSLLACADYTAELLRQSRALRIPLTGAER